MSFKFFEWKIAALIFKDSAQNIFEFCSIGNCLTFEKTRPFSKNKLYRAEF